MFSINTQERGHVQQHKHNLLAPSYTDETHFKRQLNNGVHHERDKSSVYRRGLRKRNSSLYMNSARTLASWPCTTERNKCLRNFVRLLNYKVSSKADLFSSTAFYFQKIGQL